MLFDADTLYLAMRAEVPRVHPLEVILGEECVGFACDFV
jgi:hypothetical protein